MQSKFSAYKEANQKFLEENAKVPGVVTLPSGVQYKVKVKGKGVTPRANSLVQVYYKGRMINGKEFDSNMNDRVPAVFRPRDLILGWQEVLRIMPAGSRWEIYIPFHLGYGSRSAGAIKAYSTLIFELYLVAVA